MARVRYLPTEEHLDLEFSRLRNIENRQGERGREKGKGSKFQKKVEGDFWKPWMGDLPRNNVEIIDQEF